MNEQQLQQQIQDLSNHLITTKSKAFDSLNKLIEEKETAIKTISELEGLLNKIVTVLKVRGTPTVDNVVQRINELVTIETSMNDQKTKAVASKKVTKPKLAEKK